MSKTTQVIPEGARNIRQTLGRLIPENQADQSTTITYLWLTFITTFVWASMVNYTQGVLIVVASTIAYVIFELVVMRRMVLHYYLWYLVTCLLAVSVSRLLLNRDMLRTIDVDDAIKVGLETTI